MEDDVGPLGDGQNQLHRSGYSATSLVQNTQAYSRDGRVRRRAAACRRRRRAGGGALAATALRPP
jgi:hypothetical protein